MKKFFFLPSEVTYGLFLVLIYAFAKLPLHIEIPVLLIGSLILFLFRRSPVSFQETVKIDGEIYLSPVYGTVESVRHSISIQDYSGLCHEVRISISFWDQKGLYLPTSGEVTYLKANKGKKINRNSSPDIFYGAIDELSHTDLTLLSKNNNFSLLRFIDCLHGFRASIWLKSGDRGRGGACFGYYPFGGTLLIYVPEKSDILVFTKEKIVPGQTVIAAIKD